MQVTIPVQEIGICWGKKFMADGLRAQTCLPVDGILIKNTDVRRRPGHMHDSDMEGTHNDLYHYRRTYHEKELD